MLHQNPASHIAAQADLAEYQPFFLLGKLAQTVAQLVDGHMHGVFDGSRGNFGICAHVEQFLVGGGVEHVLAVAKMHVSPQGVGGHEAGIVDDILGRAVRRCVGQFQVFQVENAQTRANGGRQHIDSLVDSVGADGLRAENPPVAGIEQQLEADGTGAGVIAGVAGRMNVYLFVGNSRPPQSLFAHSGHADAQIEHLADCRALGLFIGALAAENIIGGDAALPIGRTRQGDQRRGIAEKILNLDGVAHGKDVCVAGAHVIVDDNTAQPSDL